VNREPSAPETALPLKRGSFRPYAILSMVVVGVLVGYLSSDF